MKLVVLATLLCGCSTKLGPGGNTVDASHAVDGPVAADAPVDARPCAGGSAHASDADGNCFVYFVGPKLAAEAKTACEAIQAHLAIVTSDAQQAVVESIASGIDTYLGATDVVTEGTFLWPDGTPLTYTHWRTGEPNNGGGSYEEDCVVFTRKLTGGWDDRPCAPPPLGAGAYDYICEY